MKMIDKSSAIITMITVHHNEIDRLHALICLAEHWGIEPDDYDGISLHSILTQLSYHVLGLEYECGN